MYVLPLRLTRLLTRQQFLRPVVATLLLAVVGFALAQGAAEPVLPIAMAGGLV